jgi:hypothetical protein
VPVTLGTARGDLRQRLNETVANFYTDEWLNQMLNEGCRDLARKARSLLGRESIIVFAEQAEYRAPSDFLEHHRTEYLPDGSINVYPLRFRNYSEMDALWGVNQTIQQNYPEYITLWREPPRTQFVVFPVPSTAGVMRVQYFRISQTVTQDSQDLDVSEGFGEGAILYAQYKALFKTLDPRWKDIRNEYLEVLSDLEQNAAGYSDAMGSVSYGTPSAPVWQFGAFGAWE